MFVEGRAFRVTVFDGDPGVGSVCHRTWPEVLLKANLHAET